MAKNYVQDGNTVRFTATAAMKSGDVAMIENLAVVAESDIAQGGAGVGLTTGVFTVKAKATDDIKQGAVVYWSTDGATTTAGSNKRLGVAWRASGASVETVDVKINA
jgi:predicted RecA/RadA family phage recombinase